MYGPDAFWKLLFPGYPPVPDEPKLPLTENPYRQVFTGETYLQMEPPIDASSLTRWRKRPGEARVEE